MTSSEDRRSGLLTLSARNAKRQARDYGVYFVTMILAASLIYAFNGLVVSEEIKKLSTMLDYMALVVVLVSIVVVFIIGWLCSYTMKFMLSKRSRELGLYVLMGMENSRISSLFMMENIAVGAVSLVLGIPIGNIFYQALRAVLLRVYGVPYSFAFTFSLKAVLLTVLYFSMIFSFALFKSRKRIRKMKIYDLIYSDRQNESQAVRKPKTRRRMFAWSLVFAVIGTALLMTRSSGPAVIGGFFLIAFFFMFFMSFSSGVPAYFDKRPKKKYAKTNLVVFRSLASKLNTMGFTMATISLLVTGTLLAVGMGMYFTNLFTSREELTTCYDMYLSSSDVSTDFEEYRDYISESVPVTGEYSYIVYFTEDDRVTDYIGNQRDVKYYRFDEDDKDAVISLSDYTALRELLGYEPVSMPDDGYIIHCMEYLEDTMRKYNEPLDIDGVTLKKAAVYTEGFTQYLWDGNGRGFTLIVPDELAETQTPKRKIYAAMTSEPVNRDMFRGLTDIRDELDAKLNTYGNELPEIVRYDTVMSKGDVQEENASMYALMVLPLFYLALVLTMTALTILTTQLLSDTPKYRRQFDLLSKLGMSTEDMGKSVKRQFGVFYTMPILPPAVICLFFMLSFGNAFDPGIIKGAAHLWSIIGMTFGLFLIIYLVYVAIAYVSFKRSVLAE